MRDGRYKEKFKNIRSLLKNLEKKIVILKVKK